jgi:hypothetical protein
MTKQKMSVTIPGIVLTLSLLFGTGPWSQLGVVMAAGGDDVSRTGAGIGMIESAGEMTIDQRVLKGSHPYSEGETVSSGGCEVRVSLDGVGMVVLAPGSMMKVELVTGHEDRTILKAALLGGRAEFSLSERASAVVRVNNRNIIAGKGSIFSLEADLPEVVAAVTRGRVQRLGDWGLRSDPGGNVVADTSGPVSGGTERTAADSPRYRIVPVDSGRRGALRPYTINDLKFQVVDRDNLPVRGALVSFGIDRKTDLADGSLGSGQISTRNMAVVTDREGIATIPFRAGKKSGTVLLTAAVGGIPVEQDQTVAVDQSRFWTKKTAIPVFGVIAAVVTAAIIVMVNRNEQAPINGTGPIVIVP